ncbi:uncharacterized protein DFL_001593 [Arthrobotrys flagrans]|uniref:FAS1 domain-containing protein n=2 Tax=Arthrobotrys flagrans TaxID=97331 RepID=A0A437A817_ARTFL|nr:hypothetical protein DFL_001593 [Arthrobotrys flagrans]
MRTKKLFTTALLAASTVKAQSFLEVVQKTPELSLFSAIVSGLNDTFTDLLKSLGPSDAGRTILVPNDQAIQSFMVSNNIKSPADVPVEKVIPFLSYHVLVNNISSAQFAKPGGAVVETKLQDERYALLGNNSGQVVFGTRKESEEKKKAAVEIKSGVEGGAVQIVKQDVVFNQGFIHVVDGFLTLPTNCSKTIEHQGAERLVTYIKRLGLLDTLDSYPGATCFAPSDAAIENALPVLMNMTDAQLIDAIKFHTLLDAYYTPNLKNGQVIETSLIGASITVNVVDGDYYFNGVLAKTTNDIARNGVAYLLDGIMPLTFNGTITPSMPSTTSAQSTSTAPPTGTSTGVEGTETTVGAGTTTPAPTAIGTPNVAAAATARGSIFMAGALALLALF